MPPVIIWAIGAVGAVALGKLVSRVTRRVNAELDGIRRERAVERPIEKLERDAVTGDCRPRKS